MADVVDEISRYMSKMDLGTLHKNATQRTTTFVQDLEFEKEDYRAKYDNLEQRLKDFPPDAIAPELVTFNRFEWKLDWVSIIKHYNYDANIVRAFTETRDVKISGAEMLDLFREHPELTDVFVVTFQKKFYAFDANTTALHFARLPANMYAAVVGTPDVNFSAEALQILADPEVCPENKKATFELFTDQWMVLALPDKNYFIVQFLEMCTNAADNDEVFCRRLCEATVQLTATTTKPIFSAA